MKNQGYFEKEETEKSKKQRAYTSSKNKENKEDIQKSKRHLTGRNSPYNRYRKINKKFISTGYINPENKQYLRQLDISNYKYNSKTNNNKKKRVKNSNNIPICTCKACYDIRYDCNSNIKIKNLYNKSTLYNPKIPRKLKTIYNFNKFKKNHGYFEERYVNPKAYNTLQNEESSSNKKNYKVINIYDYKRKTDEGMENKNEEENVKKEKKEDKEEMEIVEDDVMEEREYEETITKKNEILKDLGDNYKYYERKEIKKPIKKKSEVFQKRREPHQQIGKEYYITNEIVKKKYPVKTHKRVIKYNKKENIDDNCENNIINDRKHHILTNNKIQSMQFPSEYKI